MNKFITKQGEMFIKINILFPASEHKNTAEIHKYLLSPHFDFHYHQQESQKVVVL